MKKVLGLSSPQVLANTVWLDNALHFGLRGCKEQRELRWEGVVCIKTKPLSVLNETLFRFTKPTKISAQ